MNYRNLTRGFWNAVLSLCACCLLVMTGCDGGGTDGETYTLFECPTSPSSIGDFAPYRDPASVEGIRATIYAEISSRIETSQLATCADPGDWDDCVEGSYATADGAQVEYRLASVTTTTGADPDDTTTETISEETAHIALAEGAAAWGELEWSATGSDLSVSYYGDGSGSHDETAFQASWTGSLAPELPADFALQGLVGKFFGDNVADMGDYATLTHESCDFSVTVSEEPTVYIRIYDHELRSNDQEQGGNCTIDGVCVGVIDIEAWEIVGGCG